MNKLYHLIPKDGVNALRIAVEYSKGYRYVIAMRLCRHENWEGLAASMTTKIWLAVEMSALLMGAGLIVGAFDCQYYHPYERLLFSLFGLAISTWACIDIKIFWFEPEK